MKYNNTNSYTISHSTNGISYNPHQKNKIKNTTKRNKLKCIDKRKIKPFLLRPCLSLTFVSDILFLVARRNATGPVRARSLIMNVLFSFRVHTQHTHTHTHIFISYLILCLDFHHTCYHTFAL